MIIKADGDTIIKITETDETVSYVKRKGDFAEGTTCSKESIKNFKHELERDKKMSFAYIHVCNDGFIAAADKRRTVISDAINQYYDDAKKIFVYPELKSVILTTGQIGFGETGDITIADIVHSCSGRDIEEIMYQATRKICSERRMYANTMIWGVRLFESMSYPPVHAHINRLEFGPEEHDNTYGGMLFKQTSDNAKSGFCTYNGVQWAVDILNALHDYTPASVTETLPIVKNKLSLIAGASTLVPLNKRTVSKEFTIVAVTCNGIETQEYKC